MAVAGCGTGSAAGSRSSATQPSSTAADASAIRVVASTNVWGDIVATIGGDAVVVDSLISDPAQDPHSFEAGPRALLAMSKAALIVENGGGYDDFMETMHSASHTSAPVINAVTVSGKTASPSGELNEHVWYDFPTAGAVAAAIASELSIIDPAAAPAIHHNLTAFQGELATLESTVAQIRSAHAGEAVAITEPVPLYLVQAAGLENRTPPAFSQAIEDGTDVPARVMAQTLALFSGHQVRALVYNSQTTGAQTDQVIAAAKAHAIGTVAVTEVLPPGEHYISWMRSNVAALADALGGDA
jgi:zinc/manganese transport system substrate-binding protein